MSRDMRTGRIWSSVLSVASGDVEIDDPLGAQFVRRLAAQIMALGIGEKPFVRLRAEYHMSHISLMDFTDVTIPIVDRHAAPTPDPTDFGMARQVARDPRPVPDQGLRLDCKGRPEWVNPG